MNCIVGVKNELSVLLYGIKDLKLLYIYNNIAKIIALQLLQREQASLLFRMVCSEISSIC